MKKNKNSLTETNFHPDFAIIPAQSNDKAAYPYHQDIDLLILIQKLMEQQEELVKHYAELQLERDQTKKNSDRLLDLCESLATLGQDHDTNIQWLTNLYSEYLSNLNTPDDSIRILKLINDAISNEIARKQLAII